ncbi:phosphate ABC transporter substrate-binding protein PstS [Microbacterium sediminis]|uniref:Phosphate-binding protein n=1 Tax=Microbacterium sediminis TaxID=904291 RepID=A0A1B9N801_9MICO|nr:phosphate ABC transporter substrate-binding protein PstS [Microbacterium sediminis]OCG72735.1 phosphate ABC transporter substrate-binding protein PstS [Microbacterium sediminis]QBR74751.1 phosphate ABC transporter substrate-binding protein PstS [Microbacterium sediminis]
MKITRFSSVAALGAVAALSLVGCAANEPAPGGGDESSAPSESTLSGTIEATGASSQETAQSAWVAGFQTLNSGATVNYTSTGSGPGRDNFVAGSSDFIGSDRAFNADELAAGEFGSCATSSIVEIPVYISPVAVAFNLEGVDELKLDGATIAGIFAGEITNWNDPAIADQNPDVTLPDQPIVPVHRADDSGTQETFTNYLSSVAPDVWTWEADGVWPSDLGGEAADGTSGVVSAISEGSGYIGFADASQAGELGQVAVEVQGEYVEYSAEAASALVAASPLEEGREPQDLAFAVDPAAAPAGSYPIALVSYLIGCVEYEDAEVAPLVKAYFEYVASEEGQEASVEVAGNAPISEELRTQIMTAIDAIVTE